jgi:hypothetical protein
MMRSVLPRTALVRSVAAGLEVVLLALSVSAGFHSGDHDDLGWLPSRFHHHDYQWANEPPGAPLPLVDHCLACHIGRTLVRFAQPAMPLPEVRDPVIVSVSSSADASPRHSAFPSTPRAPPAS